MNKKTLRLTLAASLAALLGCSNDGNTNGTGGSFTTGGVPAGTGGVSAAGGVIRNGGAA